METSAAVVDDHADEDLRDMKLGYATLARGVVSLLFALLAIANPWMSLRRLAILFAVYAVADAALAFFAGGRVRRTTTSERARVLGLEGLISGAVAVLAIAFPAVLPLRLIGGLRAIAVGSCDILWARRGHASDLVELSGIVACLLGVLLVAWPGPATIALPWLLGLSTLVPGALLFAGAMSQFRQTQENPA